MPDTASTSPSTDPANTLLLISSRSEDEKFAKKTAKRIGATLEVAYKRDEFRRFLVTYPQSLVFWDADNQSAYDTIGEILPKYAKQNRVFAITDSALEQYPHLYRLPVFGHHFLRHYTTAGNEIYSRLIESSIRVRNLEIRDFFPESSKIQQLTLARTSHKWAAIEAIQNVFGKQGYPSRLAALIAQATDELLINAIFMAPVDQKGKRPYKNVPRDQDIDLTTENPIDLEVALGDYYSAVCVSDLWGSLERRTVIDSLRQHFEAPRSGSRVLSAAAHLGLHGIIQMGLSLCFTSYSKRRTRAFLIIPRAENMREFKKEFRFFSIF